MLKTHVHFAKKIKTFVPWVKQHCLQQPRLDGRARQDTLEVTSIRLAVAEKRRMQLHVWQVARSERVVFRRPEL